MMSISDYPIFRSCQVPICDFRGAAGCLRRVSGAFLRYALKHLRALFPALTIQMPSTAGCDDWGRHHLVAASRGQELLTAQDYEVMDCVPVPVTRGACSFHPGWLVDIARIGKGGNDRYFYGLHLLLIASASGLAGYGLDPGRRKYPGSLGRRRGVQCPGGLSSIDGTRTPNPNRATFEAPNRLDGAKPQLWPTAGPTDGRGQRLCGRRLAAALG